MTLSVVAAIVVIAAALVAIAVATRRVHNEIEPTVAAFASFRAAIAPAVAGVTRETALTRQHLAELRDTEVTVSDR